MALSRFTIRELILLTAIAALVFSHFLPPRGKNLSLNQRRLSPFNFNSIHGVLREDFPNAQLTFASPDPLSLEDEQMFLHFADCSIAPALPTSVNAISLLESHLRDKIMNEGSQIVSKTVEDDCVLYVAKSGYSRHVVYFEKLDDVAHNETKFRVIMISFVEAELPK